MNEEFELENDLFVSVESESDDIETKYKFTFTDNKTNQSGTISITVNNFDGAAENSNKLFDEFFATLKDVSKISNYKNIAKFLPIAITEFRDLQKRKSKNNF